MKHACIYGYGDSLCGHPARLLKPCKRKCKRYASKELAELHAAMNTLSIGMKAMRAKMCVLRARRDRLVEELKCKKQK